MALSWRTSEHLADEMKKGNIVITITGARHEARRMSDDSRHRAIGFAIVMRGR